MELFNGRPDNAQQRLPRESRVYDMLDKLGIEYKRVDHEPAETMEVCKEIVAYGRELEYLLMMPADKPFKTKELTSQINSARLSFASPDKMLELLDIEPGAVSVMGLMNDSEKVVNLLVDEDVLGGEYVGCHPCVNTSSLKIKTSDIFEKFVPATSHTFSTVRLTGE